MMNKSNMILLGIILILVLIIGAVVGWMVVAGVNQTSDANNSNNDQYNYNDAQYQPDPHERLYDPKKVTVYPVSQEPILSNINTGNINDKRMVRVRINLYVTDPKFITQELTPRNTEVVDAIYTILRSKTPEQYVQPDIKDNIRSELLETLCTKFRTNTIVDVFFDEFVTQ